MTKVDGWTEGRYNGFVTSTLRGGMRRWPPKWQCLKDAYVGKEVGPSGRPGARYKCAKCAGHFPSSSVEVDHIVPVVDVSGFTTWDDYIDKLFCSKENLQVLCKPCHKLKTKEEKEWRLKKTLTKEKEPLKGSTTRRQPQARSSSAAPLKNTKKPKQPGKKKLKE